MLTTASRAETQGPSGFSLASIMIASAGGWCSRARASIGSVTIRIIAAADTAVDRVRKERRDVALAITHLVAQSYRSSQFSVSVPSTLCSVPAKGRTVGSGALTEN